MSQTKLEALEKRSDSLYAVFINTNFSW